MKDYLKDLFRFFRWPLLCLFVGVFFLGLIYFLEGNSNKFYFIAGLYSGVLIDFFMDAGVAFLDRNKN